MIVAVGAAVVGVVAVVIAAAVAVCLFLTAVGVAC